MNQRGSPASLCAQTYTFPLFYVSFKELALTTAHLQSAAPLGNLLGPQAAGQAPAPSPEVPVGAWSLCPGGLCSQAPLSHSQPPALSQLVSLYLGRSHFLWKEPATMSWLEENVREVLQAVDSGDPTVEACESRWAWRPGGTGQRLA